MNIENRITKLEEKLRTGNGTEEDVIKWIQGLSDEELDAELKRLKKQTRHCGYYPPKESNLDMNLSGKTYFSHMSDEELDAEIKQLRKLTKR